MRSGAGRGAAVVATVGLAPHVLLTVGGASGPAPNQSGLILGVIAVLGLLALVLVSSPEWTRPCISHTACGCSCTD